MAEDAFDKYLSEINKSFEISCFDWKWGLGASPARFWNWVNPAFIEKKDNRIKIKFKKIAFVRLEDSVRNEEIA